MLKGVNLGGWLVLEKWITPTLFGGTKAKDEYSLCKNPSKSTINKITTHRNTFITEKDFVYLNNIGINTVRIPVGYWLYKNQSPYINHIRYLKKAFKWGERHNISIIIDLHAAPGSQNGCDHSGKICIPKWHANKQNLTYTINLLTQISKDFTDQQALLGVELLNEPHHSIPIKTLSDFYLKATDLCDKILKKEQLIIINEIYRPLEIVSGLESTVKKRAVLDLHHYQCFSEHDKNMTLDQHINYLQNDVSNTIKNIKNDMNILIGEWSLGLDPRSLTNLSKQEKVKAHKKFGKTQLKVYSNTLGWFFWNYKSEQKDNWNFRHLVESKQLEI